MAYIPSEIEPHWQKKWEEASVYRTSEDSSKKKFYVLDMFPYPSGIGLHVGHALYTASDVVSRYKRMQGFSVLHPMGWDAFGLPAEQNAISTGEHPAKITKRCIDNIRRQLKTLGLDYDWSREISTCDPSYYKWTQKIFRLLYEKGLAYQAEMQVNWCPELKTVLANDEVIDGKSERGGHPVFRVPMRQWMLKITAYAERLLNDLDKLDWPDATKEIQRHWIGKSTGAKIKFSVKDSDDGIEVFTTRPDTLFGATYMVLAPEHPLVEKITTSEQRNKVKEFQKIVSSKSDLDRTELNKDKNGCFTGAFAIHPFTRALIPVWIADYVLLTYGTGAIMAVPAHDERDHEFAKKYDIPIVQVIDCKNEVVSVNDTAYTGDGKLINSDFLNDLDVNTAKAKMISELQLRHIGEATTNYKLRDWIFSRQRYWGEPIPILKDSKGNVVRALEDNELPLTLPEVQNYEPTGTGESPLATITSWVQRKDKDGKDVFVETHTMPGAAGSSWYFLRYCDPHNTKEPYSMEKAKYWMPVDLYIGGQEHAVGHLLYSRFWTKVLFDAGQCPVDEPFQKLVHQGILYRFGAKMSKSKGNGINPDDLISQYGADTLRVYLMFMGPFTQSKEWDDANVGGVHRFLNRIERLYLADSGESLVNDAKASDADLKILHKTIKKVGEDIENLAFNTAISQMMICLNHLAETSCKNRDVLGAYLKILSPFAPHLAEHLWHKTIATDASEFIVTQPWPQYDPQRVIDNELTLGVQVNGKHRGEITLSKDAPQAVAVEAAMAVAGIKNSLEGKEIRKVIYVPNRILNFVV